MRTFKLKLVFIFSVKDIGHLCGIMRNKCYGETFFVTSFEAFDKQINFSGNNYFGETLTHTCISGLGVGWGGGTHCGSEIVQPETTFHVTVQPLAMMTFVLQDGCSPLYTYHKPGNLS